MVDDDSLQHAMIMRIENSDEFAMLMVLRTRFVQASLLHFPFARLTGDFSISQFLFAWSINRMTFIHARDVASPEAQSTVTS